jgi:hypothetical protein
MLTSGRRLLCLGFATATLLLAPSAQAAVLSDVAGIVTYPIGLRRASHEIADSVDRTTASIQELEAQTNFDASQRIAQIREIVRDVLDSVDKNVTNLDVIIQRALSTMQDIERHTYEDAVRLLYRAQCVAEVVLIDEMQRGLGEMIGNIIKANPGVKILGIRIVDVFLTKVKITDPDLAYSSTKAHYLSLLKETKETDPAF